MFGPCIALHTTVDHKPIVAASHPLAVEFFGATAMVKAVGRDVTNVIPEEVVEISRRAGGTIDSIIRERERHIAEENAADTTTKFAVAAKLAAFSAARNAVIEVRILEATAASSTKATASVAKFCGSLLGSHVRQRCWVRHEASLWPCWLPPPNPSARPPELPP